MELTQRTLGAKRKPPVSSSATKCSGAAATTRSESPESLAMMVVRSGFKSVATPSSASRNAWRWLTCPSASRLLGGGTGLRSSAATCSVLALGVVFGASAGAVGAAPQAITERETKLVAMRRWCFTTPEMVARVGVMRRVI